MGPHRALYNALCRFGDKVVYPVLPAFAKPAWNHPAGPKTVFFWAPTIKWALVAAGLADLPSPCTQAITLSGAIWTRYCLVITPINYYLSSVNFFVMCSGLIQLCRIAHY
ncbi:hypothetical protein OSTOST_17320, partial [Ostertagia ostertagi]